jgi:ActR/RegA family two-component response regulator/energy-coupling factor transporter ATP-binding protein EcfA2
MSRHRILVVDDDDRWLRTTSQILGEEYQLDLTSDPIEAEARVRSSSCTLAILDQRLSPDLSGLDLLHRLRAIQPDLQGIILTGYADLDDAVESIRVGAVDYISKGHPNLQVELLLRVERALIKQSEERRERQSRVRAAPSASHWVSWLLAADGEELPPPAPEAVPSQLVVKRIRLRNIRGFQDSDAIEIPPDGVLILGDNAAGKSTLLRAITLAALGPELANQADQRSASCLRLDSDRGFVEVVFLLGADEKSGDPGGEFCVGLEIRKGETSFRPMEDQDMTLAEYNAGPRLDELRRRSRDDFGFFCAYGALRTLADPSKSTPIQEKDALDRVFSLFEPGVPIIDPEFLAKLLTGRIAAVQNGPLLSFETTDAMREHLRDLLPFCGVLDPESCDVLPLHERTPVPLRDLSDGYTSLLALCGHLFRHALVARDWTGDPAAVQGFVLIDEIDAHLHPSWQRRILSDLRKVFPNLQLIATTHSPMVAGSVDRSSVRVLKRGSDGIEVLSDLPSVDGWRADQILTSVYFDLPTTRNTDTESRFRKYADQLADAGPEDAEVRRLGAEVAETLQIEGEGIVDRVTYELLDRLLLDRFTALDADTRRLVLAKAGLMIGEQL